MTDEEFQRIKEAEKDRLRAQKRLRETLDALKRRQEVQSVVGMSQGAKRLLRETEALAGTPAEQAGRQAARLELALEDESADDDTLQEAEATLREERAEEIVRRFKAGDLSESRPGDSEVAGDTSDDGDDQRPEKTIGRMGDTRASDEAA